MNFGKALEALKSGEKVKREKWGGYWKLENLSDLDFPVIVATLKETYKRVPAVAYQEDMLSDDWELVK